MKIIEGFQKLPVTTSTLCYLGRSTVEDAFFYFLKPKNALRQAGLFTYLLLNPKTIVLLPVFCYGLSKGCPMGIAKKITIGLFSRIVLFIMSCLRVYELTPLIKITL